MTPAQQIRCGRLLGPGQADQLIRQAVQFCWVMLPADKRTVGQVDKQVRRIVERALKDLREDTKAFGLGK
jgi:hypothetical protein